MPKFYKDAPLARTALEDFFLDISITESRKTPVPGAASRRFSMCRNYRGTNAQQSIVSLDTLKSHFITITKCHSIYKRLFKINSQQFLTGPHLSMQSTLKNRIKLIRILCEHDNASTINDTFTSQHS